MTSDRFPVPVRSAVKSNLTDWCFQNLSKRALNALTVQASTTELGKLFQIFTIHTHPFNGPLSGTTRVSQYQKGKTNLDFSEARDSEWQWHRLDHIQVCTSLQTDNHANTSLLSFFTGRMPFLSPNQQRQSTEGSKYLQCVQKKNAFVSHNERYDFATYSGCLWC